MSKKYYWNWTNNSLMDKDIDNFLEVSSKKSNDWWKNMRTTSVYRTHIEHFKEAAKKYFNTGEITDLSSTATAKTCPAIGKGLLDKCILVKAPCDLFISVKEDGTLYWNPHNSNMLGISAHPENQFYSEQKNPFFNKINIKFMLPIVFSSSKDTYMFLQPQFHQQDYPFEVVNGSVNNDRIQIAVNTLVELPKKQTEYHLKAGTILAYLWLDNNKIILKKDEKLKIGGATKFYGN